MTTLDKERNKNLIYLRTFKRAGLAAHSTAGDLPNLPKASIPHEPHAIYWSYRLICPKCPQRPRHGNGALWCGGLSSCRLFTPYADTGPLSWSRVCSFAESLSPQTCGTGWPWAQASPGLKGVLFRFSEVSPWGQAHLGEGSHFVICSHWCHVFSHLLCATHWTKNFACIALFSSPNNSWR